MEENYANSNNSLGMMGQMLTRLITSAIVLAITAFFTPRF